jgi:hypothetical protein
MPNLTVVSRKDRLERLEAEIRSDLEAFCRVGVRLKEIRDAQLYREVGFATWERYCRDRWDWDRTYVGRLITAADYRAALPTVPIGINEYKREWNKATIRELTRLEDKRDAAKVAAKVIKAVERSEKEADKDPEVKPLKLTAATVRKFVDAELGVDRSAEARAQRREAQLPDLVDVMRAWTERARRWAGELRDVLPHLGYLDQEPAAARLWREEALALADLLKQAAK